MTLHCKKRRQLILGSDQSKTEPLLTCLLSADLVLLETPQVANHSMVIFWLLHRSLRNQAAGLAKARTMTALELALVGVTSSFWFCYGVGFLVIKIGASVSSVVLFLMRGERLFGGGDQKKKGVEVSAFIDCKTIL